MTKGNCPHGEFELLEGCPQCLEERRDEPKYIVKVQYYSGKTGELSNREYTYYSIDPLRVGEIVSVPVRDRLTKAKVSTIDVPASEIEGYKELVKTIPSMIVHEIKREPPRLDPPKEMEEPGPSSELKKISSEDFTDSKPETTAVIQIGPHADVAIKRLHEEAQKALDYAKTREITKPEDLIPATDDLAMISKIKKAVEAKKREYLTPLQTYASDIRAAFDFFFEPILEADKITRSKILEYQKEQSRKEAEVWAIRRENEELTRRAAAIGETYNEPVEVPIVAPAPTKVDANLGTIGQRENWKWEITDFEKVPDVYKLPNKAVISAAVKSAKGDLKISGIRIFSETGITVREKKTTEVT